MARFTAACERLGLSLDAGAHDSLVRYRDLVVAWNDRVRLVSRSDGDRVLSKHVLESLLLLKHIPEDTERLADIGSGGGFPGIPIQVLRPDLRVSLIESARMKTLFLKEAVKQLGLDRTEVLHERAEDVAKRDQEAFDVVTSRAVADLGRVWSLAAPLLKTGGLMVSLKGPGEAEAELTRADVDFDFMEHVESVGDRQVAVVAVRKL